MKFKAYPRHLGPWLVAGAGFGVSLLGAGASAQPAPPAPPTAPAAACPVTPAYPLTADPARLQALQTELDDVMAASTSACLHSTAFYAWRGALLLAQRQPAPAIEALERALLLDPNLPGAQLDYVDALLGVGDTAAARALLQQLATRPDLPAHLRPWLARELAAATTAPDAWRTSGVVSTALGVDSNLNNAPTADALTLTFPQGPVTLALLDSARPQSGAAALTTLQWQGLKPQGAQLWLLQADLRARHTAEAATRYQQADLSATWLQAPQAPRQWLLRGGASRVDFGGQPLLQSTRASVLHQWQWQAQAQAALPLPATCQPSAGLELEWRRYPASPDLNGRYSGLVAALYCSAADRSASHARLSHQLLSVQLRLGRDRADTATRPGGDYRRADLRATWEGRYGPVKLSADYTYSQQTDSSGYSPLLNNNLARRVSRHSLRAEIAHPLPGLGGAEGFVSAELNQQTSNLAAFESRQNAAYAGLRWRLP